MHQFEKFECNSPHTPPPPSPPPLTKMIILDICLNPKLFYQSIANNRFVGTNTGKITTELFFCPIFTNTLSQIDHVASTYIANVGK